MRVPGSFNSDLLHRKVGTLGKAQVYKKFPYGSSKGGRDLLAFGVFPGFQGGGFGVEGAGLSALLLETLRP